MKWITLGVVGAVCAGAAGSRPSEFIMVPWGIAEPTHPASGSIGMFSVVDGSYLGDLVPPDQEHIQWPHTAVIGPDRLVYVSDSINCAVWRYTLQGEFLDIFVDENDGLGLVRDLHFLGEDLLVFNVARVGIGVDYTDTQIKRFGPDGVELSPLLATSGGAMASYWDLHEAGEGRLVLSDAGSQFGAPMFIGGVSFLNDDGTGLTRLYDREFCTQVVHSHVPGRFYGASFEGL